MRQLGEQFQIDDKVMTYFIGELGMSSIEDFEKMFCNAAEVASMLENVKDLEKKPIQVSRVRQAWEGCAKARVVAEGLKRKGEEACDMDTLLNKDDMDKLRNSFWARHKMKWHPTDEPSDYLVSKCSKRMDNRVFSIDDMWAVRTLQHQNRTERKRTKLGGTNLEVVETETPTDVSMPRTVFTYLHNIQVYCLALARAGCKIRPDAPREESLATDTCTVVEVPLDVVLAYSSRAQRQVSKMLEDWDEEKSLQWLIKRDEEERAQWVDSFRNSELSLGTVIKATMEKREASWILPDKPVVGRHSAAGGGGAQQRGATQQRKPPVQPSYPPPTGKGGGQPPKGGKGAKGRGRSVPTLRARADGQQLCYKWNEGNCPGKKCPSGFLHACNRELKGGRACAMTNHTSEACKNPKAKY